MVKSQISLSSVKENKFYHVYPPERKIIHPLKLVDYLHVQADKSWYIFTYIDWNDDYLAYFVPPL